MKLEYLKNLSKGRKIAVLISFFLIFIFIISIKIITLVEAGGGGGGGGGAGGAGGCFLPGTKIQTSNGYKPIENITENDLVLSYNESSKKLVYSKVTKTFQHDVDEYLIINDKIKVTPNHPLYINGKWTEAGSLKIGDYLMDENKNQVKVLSIKNVKEPVKVYNLEINNTNNYFAENILAHNKACASCGSGTTGEPGAPSPTCGGHTEYDGGCGLCGVLRRDVTCSQSCSPSCSTSCSGKGGCTTTCTTSCSCVCSTGGWYCVNQGVCSPGQVYNDGACSNCGTWQLVCQSNCQWGSSWSCVNQGACSPGQTQDLGSCGNCGTLQQTCAGNCQWGGTSCVNQGPCSPGQTQCVNGKYQTCGSGCNWQDSGTNADGDSLDAQCGDSQCDNSPGVFDSTKTATETNCADGLDNDCDGLTDCNDSDCDGSIAGTVKNQDDQPVLSADVSAKKDTTTVKSATTNSQGSYAISTINCGTYNLIASHPDYAPQTKSNVVVNPQQQTIVDFSLALGTSCEADCTYASDNIIHAACDGKNGCTFYDAISKAACDNSQPGWVRDYNESHYVTCASGSPQPKVEIAASVSCSSGTLVKVTRIVVYNGKPVKLVVAACG